MFGNDLSFSMVKGVICVIVGLGGNGSCLLWFLVVGVVGGFVGFWVVWCGGFSGLVLGGLMGLICVIGRGEFCS